jgi:hypothetical protein
MKQFPFFICLACLLLLVPAGMISAASAVPTPAPEKTGGSLYFDSYPTGATIWLDNVEIGTTQLTYFSEKDGTFDVRLTKKGYEDYPGQITVSGGKRADFYARLIPLPNAFSTVVTPATPVATATTIRRSTMEIPTSWPTPTPESPANPVVVVGAVAAGIALVAIRRR